MPSIHSGSNISKAANIANKAARGVIRPGERPIVTETIEAGGDFAQATSGLSAPQSSGFFGVVQKLDSLTPFAAMGVDIVVPGALYAASKGASLPGKGLQAVSGGKYGGGLVNSGAAITLFQDRTVNKALGESAFGLRYAGMVDSLMSPVYSLSAGLDKITGLFSGRAASHVKNANAYEAKALEHMEGLAGHLTPDLHRSLGNMLTAAKAGDGKAMEEIGKELKDIQSGLAKPAKKALSRFQKSAGGLLASIEKAAGMNALASGTHNTFEKVSKTSNKSAIGNTMWAASSVTSTILTTKDTLSDIDAFRGLLADIKGVPKDTVSSGDAMFSELPYAGQVARKALLISAPPRAVLEGINQIFNINMIRGKMPNMLMFMLPMAGSQAIGALTSGSILDTYKEMKQNENKGIANDAEHYAKLIGQAHKGLHTRLGPESSFAKELGRIYAQKGASLKETLADVQNGHVDQLLAEIKRYNTQEEQMNHQADAKINDIAATAKPSAELSEVSMINPNIAAKHQSVQDHMDSSELATASFVDKLRQPPTMPEAAR